MTRAAEQITALDVVEAVDTIPRIRECPLGIKSHVELCPLHSLLDEAGAMVENAFRKPTIADLVSSQKQKGTCPFPPQPTG